MTIVDAGEQRRLASIAAYDVLKGSTKELQAVADMAAQIAGVAGATISVLTDTDQHQVVTIGFDGLVCRREDSMCAAVLATGRPIVVRDAQEDDRFGHGPFGTGELGWVRFYASFPLITRDGVPFGALCVFDPEPHDLGPEPRRALTTLAERIVDVFELRLRTRELALSLMEIQAVQAELERSNERLASFAGQVSHDLKTPLTTISLSLSLLREQLQDGEQGPDSVGLLDRAIHGSTRMADLIDDVLDYARLGGTLRATEVDLDFVLGEVLSDLESELADVTLSIGRLPTVLGDRAQLRAVLQNLLANSSKYRDPARALHVVINARHVQRAWRIEITDNGRGVPPSDRHRVFEPLARVDHGTEGSGIGLATCRRIIGAHGGSIGIDPSVTEGARFWFELPD